MTDTTAPMTAERRAEIADAYAGATAGPWYFDTQYGPYFLASEVHGYMRGIGQLEFGEGAAADRDRAFVLNSHAYVAELLDEVERLRGACRNPNLTCLSGEYCDGCQAADGARTAMERENRDLHEENAKLRNDLAEQKQVSAVLDEYAARSWS